MCECVFADRGTRNIGSGARSVLDPVQQAKARVSHCTDFLGKFFTGCWKESSNRLSDLIFANAVLVVEQWSSSSPLSVCWAGQKSLSIQPVFVLYGQGLLPCLQGILFGVMQEYDDRSHCHGPSGPFITKVRAAMSVILFLIFMKRNSRRSRGKECLWFGNLRTVSLLSADVVILAYLVHELKQAMGRSAAECELAGITDLHSNSHLWS